MRRHVVLVAGLLLIGGGALAARFERASTPQMLCVSGSPRGAAQLNPAQIEQFTGLKGQLNAKENVFKVSMPRNDLSVTAAGTKITPAMGLTAWAAFTPSGAETMVMGDLVLTENQVNAVMSVALENGLDVTALHNHFFWESPRVMFMHIGGMGNQEKLASAVGKVFGAIKQTSAAVGGSGAAARPNVDASKTNLDPERIEAVLGQKGDLKDGVYKVTIGRTTAMHGREVGGAMGVNTWAAFVGSDDNALVDGDFAMLETELQGVLKALRHADINVVAIHNHMTGEEPRVMFLHYWGVGSTESLSRALKAALGATKS